MILDKIANLLTKNLSDEHKGQTMFGIMAGIVVGIMMGTVAGIVVGIMGGIALGIMGGIAFSEMLFIYDKKKPEGKPLLSFTAERKSVAWLESSVILFSLIGMYQTISKSAPSIKLYIGQYGITAMNMIGWGTAVVVVLYLYVKLNSLKYKRGE